MADQKWNAGKAQSIARFHEVWGTDCIVHSALTE